MHDSSTELDRLWAEKQIADRTRKGRDRHLLEKKFALVLALIVVTVAVASWLAA